jgi:hypothetical protein
MDDKHEVHLDLTAADMLKGDFLFDIHCDLVSLDELGGYLDKALALSGSV